MSSYNKIAEDLVRKCWEEHALNGFWKEANFEKHDHGTSFSLFEREEHGYQDTHGSCYSWEIVMVRDDDVWHTFEAKQKRSD